MLSSNNRLTSIVTQSLQDPEKFFACDSQNWPVCVYDFTFKSILPEYFVFRRRQSNLLSITHEDYFGQQRP